MKERRIISLCAPFKPADTDKAGGQSLDTFLEFWVAANNRLCALRSRKLSVEKARLSRKLSADKARFKALQQAWRRANPIMVKMLRGELSPGDAAEKIKRLVPDKELLKEVFELWEKITKTTQEQTADERLRIEQEELRIEQEKRIFAKEGRLLKAQKAILAGLTVLVEAHEAGDAKAAEALAEAASNATLFLTIATKKSPERLQGIVRRKRFWPVLATDELDWEKKAAAQLQTLGFGMEATLFRSRFRAARGTDLNLPARQWAKAAVRTIDETQFRSAAYHQLSREFGSGRALLDFVWSRGWSYGESLDWWRLAIALEPFSQESVPQWKPVIRKMIRQQIPEFHTLPEWATQRNSAAARGRDTPGEIQNAILDDICSALERIAPEKDLPKSSC